MNLVTIDTSPGNMSMYIAPTNTKYLEMATNASSVVIGPVNQIGTTNVSTVINGVRIDSHTSNNNLLVSFGNTSYKVTSSNGVVNACNTAVSNWAFKINPMTGDHCTAVGHNSLTNNSTGRYNTGIGADALASITTGNFNTALGGIALNQATTNSSNVAIGYNAMASSVTSSYPCVAVGHGTLKNHTGAGGNTAIGYNALASSTTGIGNVAIGYIADNAPNVATVNTTGNDNVVIGTDAASGNNNRCVVIGHGAAATADDQIILGKATGAHTTYIKGSGGLNVTGPTYLGATTIYEATGTVGAANGSGSLVIDHGNSGGTSSIIFPSRSNRSSDYAYIRYRDDQYNTAGAEVGRFEIGTSNDIDDHLILQKDPNGCVGIGTSSPGHKLDVAGNIRASGVAYAGSAEMGGANLLNGGYQCRAGTNGTYSNIFNWFWDNAVLKAYVDNVHVGTLCDYRIKENIKPTDPVLDKLCSINMFDFTHKEISIFKPNGNHIGFFAHELKETFSEYPKLVTFEKDELNEDGTIKFQLIEIPILTLIIMKSVQEQNAIVKNIIKENDDLKSRLSAIEAKLAAGI